MILVLLVVPALVAVQHDVAKLVKAFKRGLRFRASGLRGMLSLGFVAMLAWLVMTLGHVAWQGTLPDVLMRPELDGFGALQGALMLFVLGTAGLCLGLYLLGGMFRLRKH
jgi:hypothetical protein